MFDEVLAVQDKFTEWTGAGVPVPVTASVVVEGCALLVKVSVAFTVVAAVGLKVTVNGVLCPAGIVIGRVSPLITNCELFELAAETVTLAPLAVSVPEPVPLVPTTTLPRLSVVGLTLSVPGAAVPVPDNGMVSDGFEAFDVMVTEPLALPVAVGVKVTERVVVCPAGKVSGVEIPLSVNAAPLADT